MRLITSLPCMVLLITALVAGAAGKVGAMKDIDIFEWEKRIILINSDNDLEGITAILDDADYEIRDRHIYWFILNKSKVVSNYAGEIGKNFAINMRKKYFADGLGSVVLIGKDGGVKRRAEKLDLENLFALIDTMPMRQSEMARKK